MLRTFTTRPTYHTTTPTHTSYLLPDLICICRLRYTHHRTPHHLAYTICSFPLPFSPRYALTIRLVTICVTRIFVSTFCWTRFATAFTVAALALFSFAAFASFVRPHVGYTFISIRVALTCAGFSVTVRPHYYYALGWTFHHVTLFCVTFGLPLLRVCRLVVGFYSRTHLTFVCYTLRTVDLIRCVAVRYIRLDAVPVPVHAHTCRLPCYDPGLRAPHAHGLPHLHLHYRFAHYTHHTDTHCTTPPTHLLLPTRCPTWCPRH